MNGVDTAGNVRLRWVSETLALSYGTAHDGSRWRLRFDGALWNAEQLDGTWTSRGAHVEYRAAQVIAESRVRP